MCRRRRPGAGRGARGSFERFWLLLLLRNTRFGKKIAEADAGPRTYTQLGFRVTAVIVSPYARPDFVTTQTYDHTSALKLIERKWKLPPLTRRDAAAIDPLDALDLDSPPHFAVPQRPPKRGPAVVAVSAPASWPRANRESRATTCDRLLLVSRSL